MRERSEYAAFEAPAEDEAPAAAWAQQDQFLLDAEKSRRLLNYIIDIFAVGMLAAGIYIVAGALGTDIEEQASLLDQLMGYILTLLYYGFIEGVTGRSLGKLCTGTKVIREDGSPIGMKDAFLRALVRLIPFEALTFLGENGWHDRWTKTRVVRLRGPSQAV